MKEKKELQILLKMAEDKGKILRPFESHLSYSCSYLCLGRRAKNKREKKTGMRKDRTEG